MKRALCCCVAVILLSGCASTQLNYNTIDLAENADNLLIKQIGHNLSNYLDSDLAFPAQLVIGSGTATTANSVTPSFTAPLGRQFTTTSQVLSTVSASPSVATTNSFAGLAAAQSFSIGASDTWTQNYSFTTITDSRQARRLSALYRFVIDGDQDRLRGDYPPIQKTIGFNQPVCVHDANNRKVVVGTASVNNTDTGIPTSFASCVTQYVQGGVTMGEGTQTFSILVDDEYYMRPPHCILCGKSRRVNKQLFDHRLGSWLHWRSFAGARRPDTFVLGDIPIGLYGRYELFVDQRQPEKFTEFGLFILAASTDADSALGGGSGGGGGGGGGAGGTAASAGGKASPALVVVSPNTLQ